MKRGKRQVQQRTEVYQNHEAGQFMPSQEQNQYSSFYENGFNNYQNNQTISTSNQDVQIKHIQNQNAYQIKNNLVTNSLIQVRNVSNPTTIQKQKQVQNEDDQKKRKIELLKQKYLKKNPSQKKQQELKKLVTKVQPQTLYSRSPIMKIQQKSDKPQIIIQKNAENSNKQKIIISKPKEIQHIALVTQAKLQSNQRQETVSQIQEIQKLNTTNRVLNKAENNSSIHYNDNNTKSNILNNNCPNGTNLLIKKSPPPPIGKRNAPPPPPISNSKRVSNVLNRKFNKQVSQQQRQQTAFKSYDPLDNNEELNQLQSLNQHQIVQKNIQVDEEHSEIQQQLQSDKNKEYNHKKNPIDTDQMDHRKNKNYKNEQNSFNFEQVLKYWLQNPQQALKTIYPYKKQLIQYFFLNKFQRPQLTSKNPSFNNIMRKLVQAFIIHNETTFNQEQKKIVQQIFITFFYSNPKELDDIFLVGLIKTGNNSILKYKEILKQKFQFYLQRLILLKNMFLKQEINNFIQLCLSLEFFYQQIYVYLFMLSPQDQKLIQKLQSFEFKSQKVMLSLLILCRANLKNKSLVGLYLKLLFNLTQVLSKHNFAQIVLNHLKEIEIPQSLYQLSKQLKLKLLKNYQEKQKKSENVQTNAKDGLFKYFNKAIDKIKNTTTTTINNTVQKNVVKQQQPKDVIVYDPVLKRYVINGIIPEDQNQKKKSFNEQQEKKSPPPPPLGRKNQPPPPPSLPGRKGGNRLTNRYT